MATIEQAIDSEGSIVNNDALQKVCDYLNVDKNQHMAAHGKWNLDSGKLLAALESAGIGLGQPAPPVEDAKLRNARLKGEYEEEVEMFVDGLVEDIKSGHVVCQYAAMTQLEEGLPLSRYVMDPELNLVVLAYSDHPTAFFFDGGKLKDTQNGKAAIPWQEFALSAMEADCSALLSRKPEFTALPVFDPEEKDSDGEEDAQDVETHDEAGED